MPTIYPTANQRKGLLVANGIKLTDVADATDVDPSFVSRVVRGERGTLRTEKAVRVMEHIAKQLGCEVGYLWPRDAAKVA